MRPLLIFAVIMAGNGFLYAQEDTATSDTIKNAANIQQEIAAEKKTCSYPNYTFRNQDKTLGRKFLRGSLLVQGVELAALGVLLLMPPEITKWEDGYLNRARDNLKRAWSNPPVWDRDDWFLNYVTHPVAGSYYYNALRSQGASRFQSFLFSAFQSTLWEYGIEAVAEQPSIQDLISTPIVGALMGEATHKLTLKAGKNGFSLGEKILIVIFNPMFAVNNGFKVHRKKPAF